LGFVSGDRMAAARGDTDLKTLSSPQVSDTSFVPALPPLRMGGWHPAGENDADALSRSFSDRSYQTKQMLTNNIKSNRKQVLPSLAGGFLADVRPLSSVDPPMASQTRRLYKLVWDLSLAAEMRG
jgi:hypothetical protein